jgi:5-methylcytosine-specific restriction protein A
MPRKPKRPCRFPGCPNLTDGVYCEEHAKVMEQHYEKFQRGYSPGKRYGRAWKRIRDRYVHKHPLCEMCLRKDATLRSRKSTTSFPSPRAGHMTSRT